MLGTNNAVQDRRREQPRQRSHRLLSNSLQTPGQRMAQRRKELGLRQEDVAEKVVIRRKDGTEERMSRSGYCMYEQDAVTHDVKKIEKIAAVLQSTPEYIAYGVSDDNSIPQVALDDRGDFSHVKKWRIDDEWLYEQHEVEPSEVVLWQATNATNRVEMDDMLVVKLDTKPGSNPNEYDFVFEEKTRAKGEVEATSKAKVGVLSRPSRNGPYFLASKDGKRTRQIAEQDIAILGRVIAKIGAV